MAGAQFTWKKGLSLAVASNISDILAPLEALFTVEYPGVGEDGIRVPVASGGLAMTAITKGTEGDADKDYSFTGVDIVPTPRALSVVVAERDLQNASPSQVDDLILAFSEAAHQELITDLEAAIVARLTTAPYQLSDYTDLEEAAVRAAKWKVKGNLAPGDVRMVCTGASMEKLEADLVTKNLNARITGEVVNGATMYNYAGVTLFPDMYLGNNGGSPALEYGVAAVKRGIRIAYGGLEPKFKVTPCKDAVNVRLGMAVYLKVDIPNPALACWVRTNA